MCFPPPHGTFIRKTSYWIKVLSYIHTYIYIYMWMDLSTNPAISDIKNKFPNLQILTLQRKWLPLKSRAQYLKGSQNYTCLNDLRVQTCSLTAGFHWRRSQRVRSCPGTPPDSDFGQYTLHKRSRCRTVLLHPILRDPLSVYFHLGINRGKIRTRQNNLLSRTVVSSAPLIWILSHKVALIWINKMNTNVLS